MIKGTMGTYDPALVSVIINGVPMFAFADGQKVTAEYTNDFWSLVSGTDAFTTRIRNNDYTGKVTLTLSQGSPCNDLLSGFMLIDMSTPGGLPFPILIKDLLGTSLVKASSCMIAKPPVLTYSKELENREWTVLCADLDIIVGGHFQFGV
jgi:hypothetical protein